MKLKAFLRGMPWSQQKLADAAGVSQPCISKLVSGKPAASLAKVILISNATAGQVRVEEIPMSGEAKRALRQLRREGK